MKATLEKNEVAEITDYPALFEAMVGGAYVVLATDHESGTVVQSNNDSRPVGMRKEDGWQSFNPPGCWRRLMPGEKVVLENE